MRGGRSAGDGRLSFVGEAGMIPCLTRAEPAAQERPGEPARFARLLFRSELWLRARLMPLQVRGRSLERTLELVEPSAGRRRFAGLSPAYVVRAVRRTTRRPWAMRDRRCLREGLLACLFLAEAGLRPKLHFGVKPDALTTEHVAAHCWVTLDGSTVIGESETPYVEILVHPAGTAA